ncbi:hypothetical protein RYX36_004249, partial [Vicia faba]
MGNIELLCRGNNQLCPSGCEYKNGVDDIERPKYYVVWNNNINTHIYQEFVISFKASLDAGRNELSNEVMNVVSGNNSSTLDTIPRVNADGLLTNTRRGPTSPWLSFLMLIAAIKSRVPLKRMLLIKEHYIPFMVCKVAATKAYVLSDEISLLYHFELMQAKKIS